MTGGIVLLYHRVTRLPTDPQGLVVSPENFAQHMRWLRESCRPMRLSALAAARENVPERAVAVTFDDGYADNLEQAEPVLRGLDVAATVFVAGRVASNAGEFFWDELDRIFLQPGELPTQLELSIGSERFEASLGRHAVYTANDHEHCHDWNVMRADDPTPRHRIYRDLCATFYKARSRDRAFAMERLREWASIPAAGRKTHRLLSADQLRQLAQPGLIEIGAHTITHARLAAESIDDQRAELVDSKRRLEEVTGMPVRAFSYPFGTRDAFTAQTVQIVREAGFECACANFARRVGPQTDALRLPRFVVRDWPLDEFRRQVAQWSEAPTAY